MRYYGTEKSKNVTNIWTENVSLVLEAGTYIVEGAVNYTNAETAMTIRLNIPAEAGRQSVYAPDSNSYSARLVVIITLSTQTTITLQSWTGKTYVANGFSLNATKLK